MVQGLTWTPGFGEGTEFNDKFSGAGMLDTIMGLKKAVEDNDKAATAAYSVGLAFDVVGAALNPLGAVIGAGVGWLIDHIAFLREPLDLLVGDNIAIRIETEKVKEDAKAYEGLATTHLDALKKLDGWMGETAERFRASMVQVAKELEAIGSSINSSAKLMATMGACVTAVRSLVRDIIAMVIGNLIGGALIAAGLAPITFGASIVAFVGTAVATALEALSRIMRHVTKLKSIMTSSAKSADELGTALVKLSDDAARFGKGGGSADVPTPPPVKGPTTDAPTPTGGSGGAPKPPSGDAPPVQKPPEVNGGGGGGGGGKPPAGDTPPVQKPPEVDTPPATKPPETGGGNTGTSGVKPPDVPPVKDVPTTPPPVTKPPADAPAPPPVPSGGGGGGTPKPPAGGGGGGGAPKVDMPPPPKVDIPPPPKVDVPPSPVVPKPDDVVPKPVPKPDDVTPKPVPKPDDAAPKPPAGDTGAPKPPGDAPSGSGTPKPDDAAPKPPAGDTGAPKPPGDAPSGGSGAPKPDDAAPKPPAGDTGAPKPPGDAPSGSGTPKPDDAAPKPPGDAPASPKPDDAAPKPPGSDAPGAPGTGGSKPPFSWAEVKNHVDDLSKYGKEHLENVLTTKFGKTPEEAAGISQWIKNFEELAAPGGHFTVAGNAFASGTALHMVHELWKELAADQHSQKEGADYLSDLKEFNAQH